MAEKGPNKFKDGAGGKGGASKSAAEWAKVIHPATEPRNKEVLNGEFSCNPSHFSCIDMTVENIVNILPTLLIEGSILIDVALSALAFL
jgi:hypothetical protein